MNRDLVHIYWSFIYGVSSTYNIVNVCVFSFSQGFPSWSVKEQRFEDNLKVFRTILESPDDSIRISSNFLRKNLHESSRNLSAAERKAKDYYNSCMKAAEGSTIGTTLHDIIVDVGGWNLTGPPVDMNRFNIREKVLAVQKYTTSSLFEW